MSESQTPRLDRTRVAYSIYFTGGDIHALLLDDAQRRETLQHFARLGAHKFYLEYGSQNRNVPREQMRRLVAELRGAGWQVSGAIVPAYQAMPYCYNDPAHMAMLEEHAVFCGELFDEIIIDDWLFTVCRCPRCVEARGALSWAEYRCRLLPEKAAQHLIGPAKRINPRVHIVVKFPNWNECWHHNGYAVRKQIAQFDAFCTGIETRDQTENRQHIPLYTAYALEKWQQCANPAKFHSCWLDTGGMHGREGVYLAQAYQGVLGGGRELILWCAGSHFPRCLRRKGATHEWAPNREATCFEALVNERPILERLAPSLAAPARGVDIYLPFGSDGEYNVFGYFGMLGIPLNPVADFPAGDGVCILTEHAAADPELPAKVVSRLRAGRGVLMTYGLFRRVRETELGRVFQIAREGGTVSSAAFHIRAKDGWWHWTVVPAARAFAFPALMLAEWPGDRRIAVERDDGCFSVLCSADYNGGAVHLLNLPDDFSDLYALPPAVLDVLRDVFADTLGARLRGPGRIGLYLYGADVAVLHNMNPAPVKTGLTVNGPAAAGWREVLHRKPIAVSQQDERTIVEIDLAPYEVAVLLRQD